MIRFACTESCVPRASSPIFMCMKVWQTSLHNPDFAEYANLCGALGISVRKKEELDDAIQKAIAHEGLSLVEIHSDVELI